jgi:hypothetical protein
MVFRDFHWSVVLRRAKYVPAIKIETPCAKKIKNINLFQAIKYIFAKMKHMAGVG